MSGAVQPLLSYGPATGPPPTFTWTEVDGMTFSADSMADLAISNSTHATVVTQGGNAGYSIDGGNTWTRVAGPLGNITQGLQLYANTAGTSLVALGLNSSNDIVISHSADGGITWTDVTPAGANINFSLMYSPTANKFFFFDFVNPLVWTSSSGATWASSAISAVFIVDADTGSSQQSYALGDNGTDIVVQGWNSTVTDFQIYHSTDALTWTLALSTPFSSITLGNITYSTTQFFSSPIINSAQEIFSSNLHGASWSLTSSSSVGSVAPYLGMIREFRGALYSGWNSTDGTSIASSTIGVSWVPIPVTNPQLNGFVNGITTDGTTLFQWGGGIVSSPDGTTWTAEFGPLATGFITAFKINAGVYLCVGTDDSGNGAIWKRS